MADRSIVEEESLDPNLGTSTRRAVPHILVAAVFQNDPSDYLGEEPRVLAKRSAGSETRLERKKSSTRALKKLRDSFIYHFVQSTCLPVSLVCWSRRG